VARLRWRGLAFRLAAVMLGLAPLVLAETVFVILDLGRPTYGDDPFLGFSAVHPLFVLDDEGARYRIPPSRLDFFRPESFAAKKGADEFRIFCLGGSTVQGRPYSIETSFTTWLEMNLQAADPSRRWEVVNCGGVSYASYRLVPILEEVLGYQPDLIILYTGHNEFLEDRTYSHIKHLPRVVAWPCELVARTRTYTLLQQGYLRLRGRCEQAAAEGRPILGPETDAILEYRGGLEQYRRDEKWRRDVIDHFRYNLRRMVQIARDAGVPLLLVNPVCNLRWAPFKAQHRDGLAPGELQQWEQLISRAADAFQTNNRQAVAHLQRAAEIDDQHAGLHYLLAECYRELEERELARRHYILAKEHDICPLRILEPISQAVLEAARPPDAGLVDVRKLFERLSGDGIPGKFMLDHIHPSIEGHRLIADALTEELIGQGVVDPVADWREGQDQKAREYVDSLGRLYVEKGREQLEALKLWTMGKGSRVRPKSGALEAPGS
jgi:lysophospholipase L1-like esterase